MHNVYYDRVYLCGWIYENHIDDPIDYRRSQSYRSCDHDMDRVGISGIEYFLWRQSDGYRGHRPF